MYYYFIHFCYETKILISPTPLQLNFFAARRDGQLQHKLDKEERTVYFSGFSAKAIMSAWPFRVQIIRLVSFLISY
jgi:hypothetical protein